MRLHVERVKLGHSVEVKVASVSEAEEMLLTRDGLVSAGTRTVSLAEISRAYARLPMDDSDHRALRDGFVARMQQGKRLSPMPLDDEFAGAGREEYRAFVAEMAPRGLAFVTAWDLETSLLIVKTDAGRSFFGKQRANYACFIGDRTGSYEPAQVVPSIQQAFGVLDMLYRIQAQVERDFG